MWSYHFWFEGSFDCINLSSGKVFWLNIKTWEGKGKKSIYKGGREKKVYTYQTFVKLSTCCFHQVFEIRIKSPFSFIFSSPANSIWVLFRFKRSKHTKLSEHGKLKFNLLIWTSTVAKSPCVLGAIWMWVCLSVCVVINYAMTPSLHYTVII